MSTSPRRMKNLSFSNAAALVIFAGCLLSKLGAVHGFSAPIKITTTGAKNSYERQTSQTRHQRIRNTAASSASQSSLAVSNIVEGIGEEGCNLPAPSGINTKDEGAQALAVKAIFLSMGLGTILFSSGLHAFESFGTENFEPQYQFFRNTWPLAFGAVYSLAGVTHFTLSEEYENIFPTKGAWGIWNLPGSKAFHVAWTGAAELAGGLGLLAGGLSSIVAANELAPFTSAGLASDSAAALFLLTLAITPANIFMYTHGAKLPMESEPLPLQFHAVRWVMQVVLLGFLYQIGGETFSILFDRTR